MRLPIFPILVAVLSATGCSTVKGWLRPYVCECEDHVVVAQQHDELEHEEDDGLAPPDPAHDETHVVPEPIDVTETDTHDAAFLQPAPIAWQPAVDLGKDGEVERIRAGYLIKGDVKDDRVLVEGKFSGGGQVEIAVIEMGKGIEVYSDAARVAKGVFPYGAAPAEFGPFAQAAELVRDGRSELATTITSKAADGKEVISVVIWKVIGSEVAAVFSMPIALQTDNGWRKVGRVDYLTGQRNRFIQYTPINERGEEGTPEVYRWNSWEGMFRIPRPVPTAPPHSLLNVDRDPPLVTAAAIR